MFFFLLFNTIFLDILKSLSIMVYRKYVSAFILGTRYLQRVFYCLNLYNRLYALPMEQATYSAVVPWMLS